MNHLEIQGFYIYPLHPTGSKIHSDKRFVNIDNGPQGGTHWTCFKVKDKKIMLF